MKLIRLQSEIERRAGIYYEIDLDAPLLGEGGQGVVRKGEMVDSYGLRRLVAVKCLYSDLPQNVIERAKLEANVRIKNESLLEMLAFIELNDAISGKQYYVVSEYLEGVMLFDLLKGITTDTAGQQVPLAEELNRLRQENSLLFARKIMIALLSGVQALHDKGYIHRDIDPSNIMITQQGNIKLIDFGLTKVYTTCGTTLDPLVTKAGEFIGKPEYAAPELVLGDLMHQNTTSDLYSIGILFYQLITGALPFSGTRIDILEKQQKNAPNLSAIRNKTARRVIAKAMEKKQEKRFQSAAEFRIAIDQIRISNTNGSGGGNSLRNTIIAFLPIIVVLLLGFFIWKQLPPDPIPTIGSETTVLVPDTTREKSIDTIVGSSKREKYVREITVMSIDGVVASRDTVIIDTLNGGIRTKDPKRMPLDLGYAIWEGEAFNGVPAGSGKMTYKQSHLIGDIEQHTAQPGDVIEGQFENGHWINAPTWHKATGETEIVIM